MEAGRQMQFPFLMDRNTQPPTQLYESEAIVRYLYETYGGGSEPRKVCVMPRLCCLVCGAATILTCLDLRIGHSTCISTFTSLLLILGLYYLTAVLQ